MTNFDFFPHRFFCDSLEAGRREDHLGRPPPHPQGPAHAPWGDGERGQPRRRGRGAKGQGWVLNFRLLFCKKFICQNVCLNIRYIDGDVFIDCEPFSKEKNEQEKLSILLQVWLRFPSHFRSEKYFRGILEHWVINVCSVLHGKSGLASSRNCWHLISELRSRVSNSARRKNFPHCYCWYKCAVLYKTFFSVEKVLFLLQETETIAHLKRAPSASAKFISAEISPFFCFPTKTYSFCNKNPFSWKKEEKVERELLIMAIFLTARRNRRTRSLFSQIFYVSHVGKTNVVVFPTLLLFQEATFASLRPTGIPSARSTSWTY